MTRFRLNYQAYKDAEAATETMKNFLDSHIYEMSQTNTNLRENWAGKRATFAVETMNTELTTGNYDKAYNVLSFSPTRYLVDLFNSKDFQHSYTKYEISFKGDIDSGRYSEADYQSDVDAINIYERIKKNENKAVCEIWNEYYYEIKNGDTNRAKELFENLGDGDIGAGMLVMQDILNEETIGSQFIIGENEEKYKVARKIFMEWLYSEYYNKEYVFPEYIEEDK